MSGTRNLIAPDIAERSRTPEGEGGYTFNAFPPEDYEGTVYTIAALRLGEHAHLDISTGRQMIQRNGKARDHRARAGHLILRWPEWELLRDLLDSVPWTRIAEVERPTEGQLRTHLPPYGSVSAHQGEEQR